MAGEGAARVPREAAAVEARTLDPAESELAVSLATLEAVAFSLGAYILCKARSYPYPNLYARTICILQF